MSYEEINLIQCMNIINEKIPKCMIMYDQILGYSGLVTLYEGVFN